MTLLPRFPRLAAQQELENFLEDPSRFEFQEKNLPKAVRFAPTGGHRVSSDQLREVRKEVIALARRHGFPDPKPQGRHSRFDRMVSRYFGKNQLFRTGEALLDDVWSFVGVALLPDVVYWRFKDQAPRYLGGVRNTFQRLWMRARALDRGEGESERWELLEYPNEDAFVAIFERPSIGGDPVLTKAIVEARERYMYTQGESKIEGVTRLAVMRIRIKSEVRSWWSLSPKKLASEFDSIFARAGENIKGPSK